MKRTGTKTMRLQDVIRIVAKYTQNDVETCVVVADLINRGVLKLNGAYHRSRVIIN